MRKPIEFETHPLKIHNMTFRAYCETVIDGDTYALIIDLGLNKYAYEMIRLKGYDAPETYHPSSPAEKALGMKAKERCKKLIEGKPVEITTYKDRMTLGRYVADVRLVKKDGTMTDIGTILKNEHLLKSDV